MKTNINIKDGRKVILPYYDLVFKKTFASPENIHISEGFLKDLSNYDPLGLMSVTSLEVETPYNFKDVNQLVANHQHDILSTEVDFACKDINGYRFAVEMQIKGQTYLEERLAYNTSQKYSQLYANVPKGEIKYQELKPVISVTILYENYYDDHHVIRYLRPHDERIHAYKKNASIGLEIVIELQKKSSHLPKNLQSWIHYFKTGEVLSDGPSYIREAAKLTEITAYSKEERKLLDAIDRAEQKRLVEDDYIRVKTTEQVTKQRNLEIAKSLLVTNMTTDEISLHTGLTLDEVITLKSCKSDKDIAGDSGVKI